MPNDDSIIQTPDQARGFFLGLSFAPNATDLIKTARNWQEAVIKLGDVWISDPQQGHWLNASQLVDLARTIDRGA